MDGVKVRVALADLLTATDENGTLVWHAAVRRVPFIYPPGCTETLPPNCWNTTAADYAPDVVKFDGTTAEPPATWVPR